MLVYEAGQRIRLLDEIRCVKESSFIWIEEIPALVSVVCCCVEENGVGTASLHISSDVRVVQVDLHWKISGWH